MGHKKRCGETGEMEQKERCCLSLSLATASCVASTCGYCCWQLLLAFTVILTTTNVRVSVRVCVCGVHMNKSVACFWARSKLAKPKDFAADLLSSMSANKFDSSQ